MQHSSVMHSQLLLVGSGLVVTLLLTDVCGVRRPDYLSNARVAPEYHNEMVDSEVIVKATEAPPAEKKDGIMTSAKCCKVGERVAKEGLYCSYDIHVSSRNPNFVDRYRLKLYKHDTTKSQVREFKSLYLRIAKCFRHKDMFEKCCNYRSSFLVSMRRCRDLKGKDKRQCRLKTRKTFGI